MLYFNLELICSYFVQEKKKIHPSIRYDRSLRYMLYWSFLGCSWRHLPCDQLDKVIIEGDASTGIKDRGATIPVEVSGHHLKAEGKKKLCCTTSKPLHSESSEFVHTWSSVYPRMPFMGPSAAALTTFLMSSYLACSQKTWSQQVSIWGNSTEAILSWRFGNKLTGFSRRTVRSTTDTLGVGTRKAMPVSLLKQEVTSIRICLDCRKEKQKTERTSNT